MATLLPEPELAANRRYVARAARLLRACLVVGVIALAAAPVAAASVDVNACVPTATCVDVVDADVPGPDCRVTLPAVRPSCSP